MPTYPHHLYHPVLHHPLTAASSLDGIIDTGFDGMDDRKPTDMAAGAPAGGDAPANLELPGAMQVGTWTG